MRKLALILWLLSAPLAAEVTLDHAGEYRLPAGTAWSGVEGATAVASDGTVYVSARRNDFLVGVILPPTIFDGGRAVEVQAPCDMSGWANTSTNQDRLGGLEFDAAGVLRWSRYNFYLLDDYPTHGVADTTCSGGGTGPFMAECHGNACGDYLFSDAGKSYAGYTRGGSDQWGSPPGPSLYDIDLDAAAPFPAVALIEHANVPRVQTGTDPSGDPLYEWPGSTIPDFTFNHLAGGGAVLGNKLLVAMSVGTPPSRYGVQTPTSCRRYKGYHADPYRGEVWVYSWPITGDPATVLPEQIIDITQHADTADCLYEFGEPFVYGGQLHVPFLKGGLIAVFDVSGVGGSDPPACECPPPPICPSYAGQLNLTSPTTAECVAVEQ